jgi:hypothetical protein
VLASRRNSATELRLGQQTTQKKCWLSYSTRSGGPFFAFGLRANLYRQILPPSAVLSVWRDEFRGIHDVGGLTMLILHPQYTGRPSRLRMLQALVDEFRAADDVWLTHGAELARTRSASRRYRRRRATTRRLTGRKAAF